MPIASAPRSRREKPPGHHCGVPVACHSQHHGGTQPSAENSRRSSEPPKDDCFSSHKRCYVQIVFQVHERVFVAHVEVVTELFEDA